MRDILKIIDEIIEVVPTCAKRYDELKWRLEDIQDSVKYTAPEAHALRWDDLFTTLTLYVGGDVKINWIKKVWEIFSGRKIK